MAWVTWRQHRPQLLGLAGLLVALALAALGTDLPIRAAYHRHALASCLPPATRSGCELIVSHFRSEFAPLRSAVRYLIVLPVLAGLFVGAPLLAREYEHGTFRLAWTQGVSRRRWLLAKTLLLGLLVVAAGLAFAGLAAWWRAPFDSVDGRIVPAAFDLEGVVVAGYAFFALCVGILAGVVFRRTIPAMTAAAAAFLAVRLGVEKGLRPHYLAPLHRTAGGLAPQSPTREWVLGDHLVDALGRQIGAAREDLAVAHAQHAGIDPQEYLVSLGWRRLITYQPDGRFWTFQAIELGIFVVLGLLAVAVAVALVRRSPA
ncbi:MAG TPA: ABC transporter permease subunit [Gaiellaceae bacterium]|nr:ABC transporter permease subunit [Gaiellaceae bacterium]